MSPDMLTLVAEVLATDLVLDSVLDNGRCNLLSSRSLSRNAMSETNEEKDIVAICFTSRDCIEAVWARQREFPSAGWGDDELRERYINMI